MLNDPRFGMQISPKRPQHWAVLQCPCFILCFDTNEGRYRNANEVHGSTLRITAENMATQVA
jgi:hypothetical protein